LTSRRQLADTRLLPLGVCGSALDTTWEFYRLLATLLA
jgi:hypothetical protein